MYVSPDEIRKNDQEKEMYDKIKNIIYKMHGITDSTKFDENGSLMEGPSGFNGLKLFLQKNLTEAEQGEIKNIVNYDLYVNKIVLEKINEFEDKNTQYNQSEFEKAVLQEIRVMLKDIKKYTQIHKLDDYDKLKFALSGKNVMKYHFYASCGNAADAFAYVNSVLPPEQQIPSDRLLFLSSTQWNYLHDGMRGHTIPCIKMQDGNWYAVDPQKQPTKSGVEFITSELKPGNKIYHILKNHTGVPYMITKVTSPDNYYEIAKNEKFWDELGKVSPDKAKVFLQSIISEVNPSEMEKYLDKLEQIGYLTEADKRTLLFNLADVKVKNKQKQEKTIVSPTHHNHIER